MATHIFDEVTGVFEATLLEDMMDTVRREKRPFINCDIPDLFSKGLDYPLVYVPSYFASLPLKKDDKVLVEFHQACYKYPVLWKVCKEFSSDFVKGLQFPASTANITFPGAEKVTNVLQLGTDIYLYVTDKYCLIQQGSSFSLLSKSELTLKFPKLQAAVDNLIVETNSTKVVTSGNTELVSTGTTKIGTSAYTLKNFFTDVITLLTTPGNLVAIMGEAALPVSPGPNAVEPLATLMTKVNAILA